MLAYLFEHYNPAARPVINSNQTVPVDMQFSLLHIQDLVSVRKLQGATSVVAGKHEVTRKTSYLRGSRWMDGSINTKCSRNGEGKHVKAPLTWAVQLFN